MILNTVALNNTVLHYECSYCNNTEKVDMDFENDKETFVDYAHCKCTECNSLMQLAKSCTVDDQTIGLDQIKVVYTCPDSECVFSEERQLIKLIQHGSVELGIHRCEQCGDFCDVKFAVN